MNEEKLRMIFAEALAIELDQVTDELSYNSIPQWDSLAHMALISEIDDQFDTMLDTDDVLDMNTFAKAKEILAKYDVQF
ncbi:MAG TPA: acyl carrier protein [Candidatus Paenibacillus intestinavium]|nr:acyl carrier protein [Candidatus Paenibacillus intestinavium]